MNRGFLYTIIFIIVGVIIFFNLNDKVNKINESSSFESMILDYYEREFNGIITDKFIDESDHNTEKIIIKNSIKEEVIYLDFEEIFFYNDLSIGDSISKESRDSKIYVKRGENIIEMKFNFDNYYKRHKYHKNIDSVISKFLRIKNYTD